MILKIKDMRPKDDPYYEAVPDLENMTRITICKDSQEVILDDDNEGWTDRCHYDISRRPDGEVELTIFWPFWPGEKI